MKSQFLQLFFTHTRQSPHYIISLYNDIINHLADMVAMDTLSSISWPPPEFASHHFAPSLGNEGMSLWCPKLCRVLLLTLSC